MPQPARTGYRWSESYSNGLAFSSDIMGNETVNHGGGYMLEFAERSARCWRDLYSPLDFAVIAAVAVATAFLPNSDEVFLSQFATVAIAGTVMVAVVGAVVAAAAIAVSFLSRDDLRRISESGHGLADELWAFEFVALAGLATVIVGLLTNAVLDRSFDANPSDMAVFRERLTILVISFMLLTTLLGVARLVRVVREIAELRLESGDSESPPDA